MATPSAAKSLRSIYQLKVTLNYIRPPIWRRSLIASTDSLADLHLVVQIVMGWTDSHLHEFVKDGEQRYGVPDEDFRSDIHDESEFRIEQVLKQEKDKLIYTYDFGDGWDHAIVLEKILPFETQTKLSLCLSGNEGTLGALMNDKTLYNKINDAILSAEILMDDLRTHPKRYVNLSGFGKKDKGGPLTSPAKKDTVPAGGN